MLTVRAQRLAFAYSDAAPLFEGVSFQLSRGFTGLVGANGAGKTTLLRLLSGELRATEGSVTAPGAVLCAQVAAQVSAEAVSPRLQGQLRLDPSELARWETLSPGEKKRWQLGAVLTQEPDVLLLDEPTNHLDAQGRSLLINALRSFRGVGVIVSHDRGFLNALTTSTLRLDHGGAQLLPLPYDEAREQWERERRARLEDHHSRRDQQQRAAKQLAQAREAMRGATRNRSTKARRKDENDHEASSMGAKNLAEWAQKRIGRQVSHARQVEGTAAKSLAESDIQKELGRSLFVRYEQSPKPLLAWHDGKAVSRDSRIWISGDNGAGKTTLVRNLIAASGLPAERVLYLPQEDVGLPDLEDLDPDVKGRALSLVAALGVEVDRLLASEAPSPGEARKVALALGLARQVWLLVLDEPTNHLDLPSIERIEAALTAYPGALLLVTHDEALARACTTESWRLEHGRLLA